MPGAAPRSHPGAAMMESSISSVKRTVYLVALPLLAIALAVFSVLAWQQEGLETLDAWAFPVGLALVVLTTAAVAFRWVRLRWLEYAALALAIGGLLALMGYTAFGTHRDDHEATAVLWWLGYWLPVLYGFVFMVFGVRLGAIVSVALYLVALGTGMSHFVHPEGHSSQELLMLGQTYLSNIVIIVVLIGVATILRRQTRHSDRLEEEVHTDMLTGLPNRRYLSRVITEEMARAERYHRPFAVVLFDLDHFKLVNDRYGHTVGDDVLRTIGPLLAQHVRETDTLGRWGGEEFLVILPEMDVSAASRMAERLRQVVEHGKFPRDIDMTASFGVARYWKGESLAQFLERVDQALYAAKDAGRNRVTPSP